MYRLPFIISFVVFSVFQTLAQSPHGERLQMNCIACHNTDGWQIAEDHWNFKEEQERKFSKATGSDITVTDSSFNHFKTDFPLRGIHESVDCRSCHPSLIFNEASTQCVDCHLDVHAMTVGNDCVRCHTSENWLVDDIPEIHEQNGFPLIGSHGVLSCVDCHISETSLKFDRIGNDCYSCHRSDFENTDSPNHIDAGFSINCLDCHSPDGDSWDTDIVDHSFFPLTLGHDIQDCKICHTTDNFSDVSPDCISCHQNDFTEAVTPNHEVLDFNIDCTQCHTTNPGWMPAEFKEHDLEFFPIYSGAHEGQWTECIDCHTDPSNYNVFTCVSCHQNPETDDSHIGVSGYIYEDNACLACHPNGDADLSFNHDNTNFPLTGSHIGVECLECHSNGFEGTSRNCVDCHTIDFEGSLNPNHTEINLPTDCINCHTTDPDWMPATFDIHDDYYPLRGAHAMIATDCATCHNGDYNNTPNTCVGCHLDDYNSTTDPDHTAAQFPTECTQCHHEDAWLPSTFDHDGLFFPIYSGEHEGEWGECIDCHTNPSNFAEFQCIGCHINPETDEEHEGVSGYIYEDNACLVCHPTGDADLAFDHNNTNFPLTGSHIGVECLECHSNGYAGTSTNCVDCHTVDFEGSMNPNHTVLNLPTDCINCHTTEPDWMPATFDIHDDYYPLQGAHAAIANDCATCHNGDYNNTPNTCIGCHLDDFNSTTDPDHEVANFSTDCTQCHNEDVWTPSTFDHNSIYPLEGAHADIAQECLQCHAGGYENTPNTCVGCHQMNYDQTTNPNHNNAQFGTDCIACHTEDEWVPATFDHDEMYFPIYSGEHDGEWGECIDCHTNPDNYSIFTCIGCHINPETDDEHNGVGGYIYEDNACLACHPTGESEEGINHDETSFPLTGAHIMTDCIDCHANGYQGTTTDCNGCHSEDFNGSTNPNHSALGISTDCISCHTTEPGWSPATFDVHDDYYALTGAHIPVSADCAACHSGDYNNTPSECVGCHQMDFEGSINPNHQTLNLSTDCINCHTTDPDWMPATFDVHDDYYPLEGAHAAIANDCATCHNGDYNNTPNTCLGCHQIDYDNTTNPNHNNAQFGTDCITCHTEDEWVPATFDHDEMYFPIYSGEHDGEWGECIDCHTNPDNYSIFTCIGCHINPETDDEHNGVGGYIYEDNACLACHPTGESEEGINHDETSFPLTGAHIMTDCIDCHANGYQGTTTDCNGCHSEDFNGSTNPNHSALGISTDCISCHTTEPGWSPATFDVHDDYYALTGAHIPVSADCAACHSGDYNNTPSECVGCHQMDFEGSINPNHQTLNLSTDCINCHTTDPDWMPATFDVHDDYYPLEGAHAAIANDCATCHNGDYNNTPNTCIGCHQTDYDNTTNPDHGAAIFPNDCLECHTQDAWTPSTFDHDGMYFPIYSGEHYGEWNVCLDCHTDPNNFAIFTCIGCHINPETDNEHNGVGGYIYEDNACLACHPTGESEEGINHDETNFPLTGAHIMTDCIDCHANGYQGTTTDCNGCHNEDFNGSINPNHSALGISTDCISCHTTEPGWSPATFDVHDDYYALTGAHIPIAADCVSCHNGDYNSTPSDCVGCHQPDYEGSANPNHQILNISNDCASCHTTEAGWSPATFDVHDDYYALTGAHIPIAADCAACHNGDYNNTPSECVGCHQIDFESSTNPNHQTLNLSTDCINCHTTDPDWNPATFDVHNDYYALNGAHAIIANDCAACHNGDYNNTTNTCIGCHQSDYDNTTNPNHSAVMFSTECLDCHTEDAWSPSTFDHNNIWPLNGAHAAIATQCLQCHANGYENTPNTCIGCHQTDYDNTNNPDHSSAMFPTDCTQCHTEDAWDPSTFDHDNQYFPIYSGKHEGEWNLCVDCHINANDYSIFSCIDCHEHDNQNEVDADHDEVNGYTYESNACFACHPTGDN